MTFNRTAAIAYAQRFWDRPCDDGLILTSAGAISVERKRNELHLTAERWEAIFAPYNDTPTSVAEQAVFRDKSGIEEDKTIQPWRGLLDCAHFLSKCLSAEGVGVNETGVAKLVAALQKRKDAKTLVERVTKVQGQRVVESGVLKKGDMIGYISTEETDYHPGQYGHSAMYVGKDHDLSGGITCHTECRLSGATFPGSGGFHFGDSWFLHDGLVYTFIHFSDDDQSLTGPMITALPGWWKVEVASTTAYYHVTRRGTAEYASAAPRTEFEQPPRGHDSAYYFRDGTKIIFIWRHTGNVAVWTPGGDRNQSNVTLNGASGQAAKVLFAHHGGRH